MKRTLEPPLHPLKKKKKKGILSCDDDFSGTTGNSYAYFGFR